MKCLFSNKKMLSLLASVLIILVGSLVFAMDFFDSVLSEETDRLKSALESNTFYVINYIGLSEHSIHMEGATIDWFEGEKTHQRFLSYEKSEISDEYLYYYTLYMWMSGHVEQVYEMRNYLEERKLSVPWKDHFNFFYGALSYVDHDYEKALEYLAAMNDLSLYGETYTQLFTLVSNALMDVSISPMSVDTLNLEGDKSFTRFYSNLKKYDYRIVPSKYFTSSSLRFERFGKPFEGVLVVSRGGNATYTGEFGLANLESEVSIIYIPWQKIHNTYLDMRNWKTKNRFHFYEGIDLEVFEKGMDEIEYQLSARHHVLIKNEKVCIHIQNGVQESEIPLISETGTIKRPEISYKTPFEDPEGKSVEKVRFNVQVEGYQNGFFSTALSQIFYVRKDN